MASVPGSALERMLLMHPFYKRTSLVILGDHVTLEAGTGCVHTSPGHGVDDYNVGVHYNLPVDHPVDGNGCFVAGTPRCSGYACF